MKNQRADIQGLRALAVGLVVVFHLNAPLLPGGYIGVDVFFVISGYLITAHLLREVDRTGTVKLSQFWARRVRRLLPAAFTVLIVSAAATLLLMPRSLLIQNLTEIGQAALYVLNWGLAANSVDYLAAGNAHSIAQHYWSLSVEEQFYILWPLLVFVVAKTISKRPKVSKRAAFGIALGVVFAASFAFSIVETDHSQASAYFITTTRAWEFAAGGLVAMIPALAPSCTRIHLFVSWTALMVIILPAFVFDASTAFPGWVAIIPVLGTAALLWAGDSESTYAPQFFAKAGPVRYLGDISYSVYLWHWPPIVLFVATQGRAPGWKWIAIIAVVTITLAALTYRFVEEPLRHGPGVLNRRTPTFAFMATGMAVACLLTFIPAGSVSANDDRVRAETQTLAEDDTSCFGAYAILNECADPYDMTMTVNASVSSSDTYAVSGPAYSDACVRKSVEGRLNLTCHLNVVRSATRHVVLIGDSHADALAIPLTVVAKRNDWDLRTMTRAGCSGFGASVDACLRWGAAEYARLAADDSVDTVFIALRSRLYTSTDQRAHAVERMSALVAAGKNVVLIRSMPGTAATPAPKCVELTRTDRDPCAWTPQDDDWAMDAAIGAGAKVIDPWEVLCDEAGCHTVIGGTIVYFDDNHLTASFSRSMAPWFDKALRNVLP